jgi:hypothetical protein
MNVKLQPMDKNNLINETINLVTSHPFYALLTVIGIILFAVSTFTDSILKLVAFLREFNRLAKPSSLKSPSNDEIVKYDDKTRKIANIASKTIQYAVIITTLAAIILSMFG